jgi:hypothetical protein
MLWPKRVPEPAARTTDATVGCELMITSGVVRR